MTHAPFAAPVVHAAASALHERLVAKADRDGFRAVSADALHGSRSLAEFAAAVGSATMMVSRDDFALIAADLLNQDVAAT